MTEHENDDATLSIGAVSRATGIPTSTLRTWERRYGFPDPARTESGHRRYTPSVVSHLELLARAIDAGHRDGNLGDYARELGFANRYDLLIARLAAREAIVAHYESLDTLVKTLKSRYNLPWDASTIRCTIRQALDNEAVRRAIDDDLLREGIDG